MQHIEVERKSPETPKLKREFWRFWINYPQIILDAYHQQERATTRHHWRNVKHYSRLESPREQWRKGFMRREDAPLPDDVKAEAVLRASHQLEVVREFKHYPSLR